jgi:flagellar biosynthetic protein FliR
VDFFDVLTDNFQLNLLIFARVLGIFIFNPLFSRRNIPQIARIGGALTISMAIAAAVPVDDIDTGIAAGIYLIMILREAIIGFVLGFITDMFFYSVQVGGEIMDMQSGLGMAKVFDPGTNVQMSIMGSFINFMMYLYFFAINAHLTYIQLVAHSFEVIPLGGAAVSPDFAIGVSSLFMTVLTLVVKMALPIMVSQLIVEFCIGALMKSVPQIQIMIVNLQIKVAFGFFVLYFVAVPLSSAIDAYMAVWLETLEGAISQIAA